MGTRRSITHKWDEKPWPKLIICGQIRWRVEGFCASFVIQCSLVITSLHSLALYFYPILFFYSLLYSIIFYSLFCSIILAIFFPSILVFISLSSIPFILYFLLFYFIFYYLSFPFLFHYLLFPFIFSYILSSILLSSIPFPILLSSILLSILFPSILFSILVGFEFQSFHSNSNFIWSNRILRFDSSFYVALGAP